MELGVLNLVGEIENSPAVMPMAVDGVESSRDAEPRGLYGSVIPPSFLPSEEGDPS